MLGFPRVRAKEEFPGQLIHLPFWEFEVDITYRTDDAKQRARAMQSGLNRVFIAAFKMHSFAAYGNISLMITQRIPEIHTTGDHCFISGCRKPDSQAGELIETLVLAIIDRKVDVTGLDIQITVTDSRLLAVPFYLDGDLLRDGVIGEKYRTHAIDDLPGYLDMMRENADFTAGS